MPHDVKTKDVKGLNIQNPQPQERLRYDATLQSMASSILLFMNLVVLELCSLWKSKMKICFLYCVMDSLTNTKKGEMKRKVRI